MAAAVEANDVVSPLVATRLTSPNPVLGADDKVHLAYEIVLVIRAPADIDWKEVETLDAASGVVISHDEQATSLHRRSSSMEPAREPHFPAAAPAFYLWM